MEKNLENNKSTAPWLFLDTDPFPYELTGNKEGLALLKTHIDKAIENKSESIIRTEEDSFMIACVERDTYLSSILDKTKTKWWEGILGFTLIVWFLILPFIAVALIVYLAFKEPAIAYQKPNALTKPLSIQCNKLTE